MGTVRTLLVCCALLALYAAFAGSFGVHEAAAGIGCISVLAALVSVLRRGQRRRVLLRPPPRVFLRTILSLLTDTLRVGCVLCGAIMRRPDGSCGRIGPVAFHSGDDRASDAGRRATVTLAASLAPNGFVLAVPLGQDAILLHRLVPMPDPTDRNWPV